MRSSGSSKAINIEYILILDRIVHVFCIYNSYRELEVVSTFLQLFNALVYLIVELCTFCIGFLKNILHVNQ